MKTPYEMEDEIWLKPKHIIRKIIEDRDAEWQDKIDYYKELAENAIKERIESDRKHLDLCLKVGDFLLEKIKNGY